MRVLKILVLLLLVVEKLPHFHSSLFLLCSPVPV
jgi:hypothetical protein